MTANQNLNRVDDNRGVTAQSQGEPRISIVDMYVYGFLFPSNYWKTLSELKELYEKENWEKGDMLRLKLLAVLLTEQLLGQGIVKSYRVLELMEEYIRVNKANKGEKND
jgi:hypothetical protein